MLAPSNVWLNFSSCIVSGASGVKVPPAIKGSPFFRYLRHFRIVGWRSRRNVEIVRAICSAEFYCRSVYIHIPVYKLHRNYRNETRDDLKTAVVTPSKHAFEQLVGRSERERKRERDREKEIVPWRARDQGSRCTIDIPARTY